MKTKAGIRNKLTVLACVLALITDGSPPCFASEDPATMAVDALLVRPFCFLGTIVGSAVFVISLPVAATSKSVRRATRALVVKPAQATFTRPLGDFDSMSYYSGESR